MRRVTAIFTLLSFTLAASAQQVGTNAPSQGNSPAKITVTTQLVVESVVVKDKKGNPIKGLTAKDFTLTEDGVAQQIKYCEFQELPMTPDAAPILPSEPEDIKIYNKLARTTYASETPGTVKYKDHRLVALYFDMTAMPPADQARALSAAEKFIRTQMTAVDLISILRYSGGSVDLFSDFAADRNRL